MKNKKSYFILFVFILNFSLVLYISINISNEHKIKNYENLLPRLSAGKSVVVDWERTWGGNEDDWTYDMAIDSSGNIYLGGNTDSFGEGFDDMLLVKYNKYGVLQWYETWGGSVDDSCRAIAVDSLGNIYITGRTFSFGTGRNDMVLVKYDSSGVQQWNLTWGTNNHNEEGVDISIDSSNNLYLVGFKAYSIGNVNITLVKFDSSGVYQWNRTWNYRDVDYGSGIAIDSLDNIFITGYTRINTSRIDLLLLKYDNLGMLHWNYSWERQVSDRGYDIAIDSSDNIYITGQTSTADGDMLLVKYNSSGVRQWYQTWGGSDGESGRAVAVDSSGNICITGDTTSFGSGGIDMALVNYSSSGLQQWNTTWGGSDWDVCSAIAFDSSDNLFLAGSYKTSSTGDFDMILVKYGKPKTESDIPGFNVYILLGILSLTIVIHLSRKKKG